MRNFPLSFGSKLHSSFPVAASNPRTSPLGWSVATRLTADPSSHALHRKFRESIAEIFENAVEHSETKHGIFACGQYFPGYRRLDFSISDLGIGIRNKVLREIGLNMSSEKAISWALEAENTTRQREDGKPGGLGLKLIKEFIRLNSGKIQIISDSGYWCYHKNEIVTEHFPSPFPGTVVNIEINTADKQSYCLASEIDPKEIF